MGASCFFPSEKVERAFKEKWLLSLSNQERKEAAAVAQGKEYPKEPYCWLPDQLIWDGIDYFLRGDAGHDASFLSRSLPYVEAVLIVELTIGPYHLKRTNVNSFIGARPLNTQFKAKIRLLLQKLGKENMEALQLPVEFLECENTKKFQADLARFWFLASLEEIIKKSGEPVSDEFKEEFQYYLEQARQMMRDAETEFLFRVKRHLDQTPCTDCQVGWGKIIPLATE